MHRLRWPRVARSIAVLLVTLGVPCPSLLYAAEIIPVSVATDVSFDMGIRRLATDDSGRFLLFESLQPNLASGQIDLLDSGIDPVSFDCQYIGHVYLCTFEGDYDVFLYDRESDETQLISHVEGAPERARSMPSKSYWLSPDGSRVLYANFRQRDAGDFDFLEDLILYDRDTRNAERVASVRSSNGHTASNDAEVRTSIDGRVVVFSGRLDFEDQASPFINADATNLYRYDQTSGTLTLVSAAAGTPNTAGIRASPSFATAWEPTRPRAFDMDASGARIVFASTSPDLVANDVNGTATDVLLYDVATGSLSAVSRSTQGDTADLASQHPSISRDGARIVFESAAQDLVAGVTQAGDTDIYLYEPDTDTMVLVSRSGVTPDQAANGRSFDPIISKDGSSIVFASTATDLVPGFVDGNGNQPDLYRYDVASGATTLVSHSVTDANRGADGASRRPRIDDSGARLLFESLATDLVTGFIDGNDPAEYDLFALTTATGAVTLVDRAAGMNTTSANRPAVEPILSQAGTQVLYRSEATDLIKPMATTPGPNAYSFSLTTASTALEATSASTFAEASTTAIAADRSPAGSTPEVFNGLDATGRFATYTSTAFNLAGGLIEPGVGSTRSVLLYDRESGRNRLISHVGGSPATKADGTNPQISADGHWILFNSRSPDLIAGSSNNGRNDIYLFERATGAVQLVSRAVGQPTVEADDESRTAALPSLSTDGRFALFDSEATNLIDGFIGNSGRDDVFLFDRQDGSNMLISAADGAPLQSGNGPSLAGGIAASGRYVTFTTHATNIVPAFVNPASSAVRNLVLFDRLSGSYTLISHDFAATATGAGAGVGLQAMSDESEVILFTSDAQNLVDGFVDGNGTGSTSSPRDLFAWERASNTVQLVSRSTTGPAHGANANVPRARLSPDGAWIAFNTDATDLLEGFVPNNVSGFQGDDVFLVERATGAVTLVSRSTLGPLFGANGRSEVNLVATERGHDVVYFTSTASDLVAGLTSPLATGTFPPNLYRYDIETGAIELITHAWYDPLVPGNDSSRAGSVSREGGFVLVASMASNLIPRDTNHDGDGFLIGDGLATDLVLRKTDSMDPVAAGAPFDYRIDVDNAGLAPATAVSVFDPLPDGLEVVQLPSDPWRCFGTDSAVGCMLRQPLAPGALAPPLDITVRAPGVGGTITNTASTSSAVPEVAPGSNTDFEDTTVIEGQPLFADGFESGDTSAWTNTVPSSRQP